MSRELIESWSDYRLALNRLLALGGETVCIYDEDMSELHFEASDNQSALKRCLGNGHRNALRIAVRNGGPLRQRQPLLLGLLNTYAHVAQAFETPPQLGHLRDSMILVDERHALIRFERDLPRSKLLIDETDEVRPYCKRFEEIWNEGGEQISASTLGL